MNLVGFQLVSYENRTEDHENSHFFQCKDIMMSYCRIRDINEKQKD